MKVKKMIYDFLTKEHILIEEEIEELEDEIVNVNETLEEKIEKLQEENKTQDILIDTTMLATDELYTMVEPILEAIPQTMALERSTSKMVDMYVCMIQRGLKTLEQVPSRYKEEVRRILTELEK